LAAAPAVEVKRLLKCDKEDKRLSLKRCRELIGGNSDLSDGELEAIRDEFYALADVMTEAYARKGPKTTEESSTIESFIGTELQGSYLGNIA